MSLPTKVNLVENPGIYFDCKSKWLILIRHKLLRWICAIAVANIPKPIPFEPNAGPTDVLCFKHYNANEVKNEK